MQKILVLKIVDQIWPGMFSCELNNLFLTTIVLYYFYFTLYRASLYCQFAAYVLFWDCYVMCHDELKIDTIMLKKRNLFRIDNVNINI